MRGLQQRVPERAEPTAPQERPQFALEAQAEDQQGAEAQGVPLPRAHLRPPRPVPRPRRPHRHQEALLPQARREEVEVREVLQALRRPVRLEGPLQDLRH